MKSSLKKVAEDTCELEMTPMIDVTFLLLIFFLLTLKFKTLEGKLSAYLPKDVGVNTSDAEEIEKVEILIKVINEGNKLDAKGENPWTEKGTRFSYDSTRELTYKVGATTFTDIGLLEERLKTLYEADDERPATIDSRPKTVYEDVVRVLDATINAGFTNITFVGAYE